MRKVIFIREKKKTETIFCHFKGLFSKVSIHSQIPEPRSSLTHNYFTLVSVFTKCKPISILEGIKLFLGSGNASGKI